jgi:hypothetical protein
MLVTVFISPTCFGYHVSIVREYMFVLGCSAITIGYVKVVCFQDLAEVS